MTCGEQPARVSALAPLAIARYRRLWLATIVSGLGTFIQLTAAPWLMLQMTGSPLLVSLVTTALLLPQLLLTLPAGALADVVDRRKLLVMTQLTSATAVSAMAVFAHLDRLTPTLLLVLTFALGCGNAVGQPSFQTLVPELVPRPMLAQAITLTSGSFNVARAVGPSIGGALVAAGFTQAAFGLNAVSYLAVIGVLLSLPRDAGQGARTRRLWRSTLAGVRYARFTRPIRTLLVVTAAFSLTSAGLQALLPALAANELAQGAGGFGILYGAFGLGALVAALTRERARLLTGPRMLPGSVVAFGVCGLVLGFTTTMPPAVVVLALAGTSWVWTITTLNASVQMLAPDWIRGRVVSLFVLTFGLQPVGAVLSGLLAEAVGAGTTIATMAAAGLGLGLVLLRLDLPVLGELDEPVPAEPGWTIGDHPVVVGGGPIVVVTTWNVAQDRLPAFLEVLTELRRQRLRTGATRWSLFRDATRPGIVTEMYSVPDWAEHLLQHRRLDAEAAEVLARARAFDRDAMPTTRHLAGLDVAGRNPPEISAQLVTVHEELHRTDGSMPLAADDVAGTRYPADRAAGTERGGSDRGPGVTAP
jgi:MFS family permease